jgi:hypothetical protein
MSDHEIRADRPDDGRSPEERSAFRAFVRDHHPDRGGDPEAFAAGLARFRSTPDGPGAPPDAGEPARPDGPLPFPVRVGVALIRTWRRRRDRPDAP